MTRSAIRTLPRPREGNLFIRVLSKLATAMSRHHDRQLLARLDDHLLRDIGVSPDEAKTECAKPFWQP